MSEDPLIKEYFAVWNLKELTNGNILVSKQFTT